MKAIVISEKAWEQLKKDLRDRLELAKWVETNDKFDSPLASEMHRRFNYEVCKFFERVENE